MAKLVRDEKPLTALPPKPRMQHIPSIDDLDRPDDFQADLLDDAPGPRASKAARAASRGAGILNDDRAHELWNNIGGLLLDNGMLSELDLMALEWTVAMIRTTEAVAADRPKTMPANAIKVLAALKSLGLTKDGRVPANAIPGEKWTFPPGSPEARIYEIDDARRTRGRGGT